MRSLKLRSQHEGSILLLVGTLFFWLQDFEVSANASVLIETAEESGP